jgi:Leucine-rich repeat (LRR) protein
MTSMNITRLWIGASFLAIILPVSSAGLAHADDAGDAKKRKAAIAAILQAGGDIRVSVLQPTFDRLERISITEVNLRKAEVDNALLIHVGNLKEVRQLDLSNAKIDDQGLRSIAHLPLRELWLQNTKITDASAATIAGIKTLNFLQLNATKMSDEFLEKLASMPELADLGLRGTLVTGDGMQHLARHPKLKKLDVYQTAIDDVGVAWLIECKSLTHVGLSMTKITNEVFQYLDEMPNLTSADLSANRAISTDAVLAFEKSHPKCDIEWYRK